MSLCLCLQGYSSAKLGLGHFPISRNAQLLGPPYSLGSDPVASGQVATLSQFFCIVNSEMGPFWLLASLGNKGRVQGVDRVPLLCDPIGKVEGASGVPRIWRAALNNFWPEDLKVG